MIVVDEYDDGDCDGMLYTTSILVLEDDIYLLKHYASCLYLVNVEEMQEVDGYVL